MDPWEERQRVRKLLRALRVPADDLVVVHPQAGDDLTNPQVLNQIIRRECQSNTSLVFLPLPLLPEATSAAACDRFMRDTHHLSLNLPPTVLVDAGANETRMFSAEI